MGNQPPNPQPTGGSSRGGKPLDSRSGKAATCALKIYPQKKRSDFCRNIQKHIVTEINVNLRPPIPPRGSSRGESPSKRQSPFNILAKLQSNFAVISKGASNWASDGGFGLKTRWRAYLRYVPIAFSIRNAVSSPISRAFTRGSRRRRLPRGNCRSRTGRPPAYPFRRCGMPSLPP